MRYFISFLLIVMASAVCAQSNKPWSIRTALGIPLPSSYHGGAVFQLDPTYRLNYDIAVGLRLEAMSGSLAGQSIVTMQTVGLNAHRYFLIGSFNTFVGAGAGMYFPKLLSGGKCACTYGTQSSVAGFYPRIGFDRNHLIFAIEYNFIATSQMQVYDQILAASSTENFNPSYLSVKVGLSIGGGTRK
jgi:hypothetical protein